MELQESGMENLLILTALSPTLVPNDPRGEGN
jgi:hypothetical protein